jgi:phosphoglycerate dehydrogenase-like enzyme
LEELLEEADVVTIHVVANEETRKMIGTKQLRRMKRTSFLINTSRAEIVDQDALLRSLDEGWIAGAGLDVLSPEPPGKDHPLLQRNNVIITPHIAGWTSEAVARFLNQAAMNLLSVLKGKLPQSLVNPEAVGRR